MRITPRCMSLKWVQSPTVNNTLDFYFLVETIKSVGKKVTVGLCPNATSRVTHKDNLKKTYLIELIHSLQSTSSASVIHVFLMRSSKMAYMMYFPWKVKPFVIKPAFLVPV